MTGRPFQRWKFLTAVWVAASNTPLAPLARRPRSAISASCSALTAAPWAPSARSPVPADERPLRRSRAAERRRIDLAGRRQAAGALEAGHRGLRAGAEDAVGSAGERDAGSDERRSGAPSPRGRSGPAQPDRDRGRLCGHAGERARRRSRGPGAAETSRQHADGHAETAVPTARRFAVRLVRRWCDKLDKVPPGIIGCIGVPAASTRISTGDRGLDGPTLRSQVEDWGFCSDA